MSGPKVNTPTAVRENPAAHQLLPLVYQELHSLANRYLDSERAGHTLQPTALVHEAFLKLVNQDRVQWQGRTHFLAIGAQAMRRILVDHARTRSRAKRGGAWHRVELDGEVKTTLGPDADILTLHALLEELATLDPRQARVVELRFFSGMTMEELSEVLGISRRTAEGDWKMARAWLLSRLKT